ncbi:hypothetical protein [Streptomyces galilaeus]|uniref:hypothetical protein n=1 Tax=Streptomyces galilaeus TaxID=33899 RepID=UPI0038F70FCE
MSRLPKPTKPHTTTNYFTQARASAAIATAALAAMSLTACGDNEDRTCLDWDTRTVSTTTLVNGKVRPTTRVETYCAEWEVQEDTE